MTPNRARTLATAVQHLGSANDEHALVAARCIAQIIEAEGVKPHTFASAMDAILDQMTKPREAKGLAHLGPRGRRKRLAELSQRYRGDAASAGRIAELRALLAGDPRAPVRAEEVAWLDTLWTAPPSPRRDGFLTMPKTKEPTASRARKAG
ncbi:hypothetical protein [Roseomonas fluvialis]|uniref:Uncharacterized protein n=1 Tax=Roseomonas fluvialis TaxID=1750527 RepID=A0ABM7Y807_9PROT|nr:hypothetical protein [Roseomonas fluvialis]BDG74086.1 hypothetical protein Rmf_40150 [Roseomonas fluvialis]